MYAIIDIGGKQQKVEKGSEFTVDRMSYKVGHNAKLPHIVFAKKGNSYVAGQPFIKGAHIECEVLRHERGKKVFAFQYRRRKSSKRKVGHRQDLTVLRVKEISI